MRVLLTGANGFIGSHIVSTLLEGGHHVIGAVRDPEKFIRRFPNTQAVALDFNKTYAPQFWFDITSNIDAIINCAGIIQTRGTENASAVHFDSPFALFKAAESAGINKIVQISAASFAAKTEYATSKRNADEALTKLKLRWVVLRPSIVYGPLAYGGTAMIRALATCPFFIPVIGKGDQKSTPIHVDDFCKTVLLCLESNKFKSKILYPCGPETLDMRDILTKYRNWFGLGKAPILEMPIWLIAIAGKLGDWFGSGPVNTTSILQLQHGNQCNSEVFTSEVLFKPKSIAYYLEREPSGAAALWQARLYLAKPLIRASLILLWAISGLAGLTAPSIAILDQLGATGLPSDIAEMLGRGASVFDLCIAMMLLFNFRPKLVFAIQLVIVLSYTLFLSIAHPSLWLDLFGSLLKNLPILALIIVQRVLDEER